MDEDNQTEKGRLILLNRKTVYCEMQRKILSVLGITSNIHMEKFTIGQRRPWGWSALLVDVKYNWAVTHVFLIAFSTRSALSLIALVTKMTALPAVGVAMQSVLLFASVKRIHALGATTVLTRCTRAGWRLWLLPCVSVLPLRCRSSKPTLCSLPREPSPASPRHSWSVHSRK